MAKPLPITRKELDWLAGAVGLHLLPDRPSLVDLLGKLPSLKRLAYAKGEVVLEEGSTGREFYVVYQGAAGVEKGGKAVAELTRGDFFGEIGFLVEVPRTATVRAGAGCEVFRFDGPDFEQIVGRVSGLGGVLRDVARQRMRKLSDPKKSA